MEKFVDMVGHIKSLPIGIFEVVGKDGDLLIVRALNSSELELSLMGGSDPAPSSHGGRCLMLLLKSF